MDKFHIINMLIEAQNDLEITKKRLKTLIENSPKAQIRLKKVKGNIYVYKRTESSQTNGIYLKKENAKEIKPLVQKLYNAMLMEAVGQEQKQIDACIKILRETDTSVEAVIKGIPQQMHKYISKDVEEDWGQEDFTGNNPIRHEKAFKTSNGEIVRSKSELIIAEALKSFKIPYIYERPFYAYIAGHGKANIYPDFTCFNRRTGKTYYWEHLGMMDNPDYSTKSIRKIMEYAKEGVYPGSELILSFETEDIPLNTDYIRAVIKKFLL